MLNTSDRYIQKISSIGLFYSRVFGICNYSYDFKNNRTSFPARLVAYSIVVDVLVIVLLPVCLHYQFKSDRRQVSENPVAVDVQRTIAISHAVAVCISLVWQWVNLPDYKLFLKRLSTVRTTECSKLTRSSAAVTKQTALILLKLLLSGTFPIGAFAGVYLRSDKFSVESIASSVFVLVVENVVMIVENQFYIGLLYCGFLFESLSNYTRRVVKRILIIDRKRLRRNRMGIAMQRCCTLCDELDSIGKMHTDIYKLSLSVTKIYGIQIYIIILGMLTTQVSLGFYAVAYFGRNNTQITSVIFCLSCVELLITTVNMGLLVNVCSYAIEKCNSCGEHLKLLTAVQYLDSRLDMEIERLAFQMRHEELRINLSGLVDIDLRTGFFLIKAAVLNLLLLIQSDYKNLYNIF